MDISADPPKNGSRKIFGEVRAWARGCMDVDDGAGCGRVGVGYDRKFTSCTFDIRTGRARFCALKCNSARVEAFSDGEPVMKADV